MFTGIIQHLARIDRLARHSSDHHSGARLFIDDAGLSDLTRGESVAVNGVCLTVIEESDGRFSADLSDETLSRTALGLLEPGERVNIERALRLSDRLGGHLVQGHVDTVGTLESIEPQGDFALYRWSYPAGYAHLTVDKGSIAVDGVSLTVVNPDESGFSAALIPETLARTNLGFAEKGRKVNLEFDVMAKYVARLMSPFLLARRPG